MSIHTEIVPSDHTNSHQQEPFGWVNMPELTNHFEKVSCGTIYKMPGEGRTPLYAAPIHASDISQERVDETAKRKHEPVAWIKNDELAYMSAVAGLGMTEWQTNLGLVPQLGDVPLYTTCPKNATTNGQGVAKSATTDWEAVAADQAMTIAMLKLEQKREWVGLTIDEIDKFMPYCHSEFDLADFRDFARDIQGKLKEKNG